jgi:nicotinamide phosphoribosyltransferase
MVFKVKPHTACDFYKIGHKDMYEKGSEFTYTNFTPRSSKLAMKLAEVFEDKIVFAGLQGFIKEFLIETWNEGFFQQPKDKVVEEYRSRVANGLTLSNVDTTHIEALYDLGYLPLSIKALPEGSLVDIKVPVFTIVNTLKEFFWLPNYIESVISSEVWKTCTTATSAYQYRKLLDNYADKTGANKDFVLWQGHDFSFRGQSGLHDAASSGLGHLISFYGTDTIPAMDFAEDYYHGKQTFIGGSVPASEHSVMCLSGNGNEVETIRRLIQDTFPTGVISVVADSWDYWKVITDYANQLKPVIMSRQPNSIGLAKTVFRPDSGDPVKIICGLRSFKLDSFDTDTENDNESLYDVVEDGGRFYKFYIDSDQEQYEYYSYNHRVIIKGEVPEHEVKGSVECLWDIFGGTVNSKGYKELDSHVGLIYGDSITLERAKAILSQLEAKGFASSNIVFGIGSFTYQYQTRDSYGFAMKATHGVVNGESRNIFKDPKTDSGIKKSAKGLLRVEKEGNSFVLYDEQTSEQEQQGELKEVFRDGVLIVDQTLEQIRNTLYPMK